MTTKIDLLAYAIGLIGRLYEWDEPRVWRFLSRRDDMGVVSDLLGLEELEGGEKRKILAQLRAGLAERGLEIPPDQPPNKSPDSLSGLQIAMLLREGWTFRQISEQHKVPASSVYNRYKQAMGL